MAYLFIFEAAGLYYEINLMNTCFTSDRVASKIKVNIKETFMRNEGFLQLFMWWMDCSQKIKELLLGKFSI